MSTDHDPNNESRYRETIRQLAEEFAVSLGNGSEPEMDDFLARVDPSLRSRLKEELVGEQFAYQFGDATQNGSLKYRPTAFLGQGRFGKVYRAVDVWGRSVAIKVLCETKDAAKERFLAEASRQARPPKHDHLVEVHDFGTLPKGHSFFVMEYLGGGTLREKLKQQGKLDAETAAQLMKQVALAVATLHEGSSGMPPLVHQDLKT